MVKVFNRHADDLIAQLDKAAATPTTPVNIQALFRGFTMDSFSDAFFGADLGALKQPSEFEAHFDYLQLAFMWRVRIDPLWKPFGLSQRTKRSLDYVHDYINRIIVAARADPNLAERTDLLAHYLRSTDDEGKPFTDTYLRDMLLNFLLAGRDTTASLLTWLFYCLDGHPDVERRLVEEVERVVGMDTDPTPAQINELRYMKNVRPSPIRLRPARQALTLRCWRARPRS